MRACKEHCFVCPSLSTSPSISMAATSTAPDSTDAEASPAMTASPSKKLRVFFLPFFATGHLIPMTDLACLLAAARPGVVEATMVVTPANAALIASTLTRSAAAGHIVHVLCYPFPYVGLEPGVEGLGAAATADACRVYRAVDLSQPIHEALLREHRPDAVVADVPFWWATNIAAELGIPRITFHPVGVFPQLAMNNLFKIRSEILQGSAMAVSVPGLPGQEILIPVAELPDFLVQDDHLTTSWDQIKAAQLYGFGVVVNTFLDLEQPYCNLFDHVDARRAYFVGPVGLSTSHETAQRGGNADVACLKWLDGKPSLSVVYLCFGSWPHFSVAQLRELALGLETSHKPFLWVVRDEDATDSWVPEGWEERLGERGMVVSGWAPQMAILAHPAVCVFVTHCGWNSMLEAAMAGVPVLTWPLVFEQFINEKLVVEVMRIGAKVWEGGKRSTREAERETVPAEAIASAVSRFIAAGGEGEKARARARELASKARAAVTGKGSSYCDLHRLIDDLVEARTARTC